MRLFLVSILLFAWLQNPVPTPGKPSRPKRKQSAASQQPANSDQRGTERSPLVIKTLEPTKSQAEAEQEAKDRQQKATNDGWIVILTGILSVVAIGQLGIYLYQAIKLRETVAAAGEQSRAMERYIGEASRSADAMEKIVTTIEAGNKAVMRAYLTVTIGLSLYQERREPGQPDLKFETRPNLVNTGNSAARNVNIRIAADILPIPTPDTFQFPLSDELEIKNAGVVGSSSSVGFGRNGKRFSPRSRSCGDKGRQD